MKSFMNFLEENIKSSHTEISELDKETLKKYVKANVQSQIDKSTSDSFKSGQAGHSYNQAPINTHFDKKREKGLDLALKKLSNNKYIEESASDTALRKKSEASGISFSTLKTVYKRGVAAWNSGHRPGTTPQQWGMARVNSYITKGKTYHTTDKDLREEKQNVDQITSNFVKHYKDDPAGAFMHAKSSYLDTVSRISNFSIKAHDLHKSHANMSKQEFQDTVMKHFGKHLQNNGFPKHASKRWSDAEHEFAKELSSLKESEDLIDVVFALEEAIDSIDQGEYDYEGAMSRTQLQTIMRSAKELIDVLKADENMPEWVQSKITKAEDYLSSVRDYMISRRDLTESESWEAGYKRRVVKTTKPEHKKQGFNWRIKGKERPEISIKLYKKKPSQGEFNTQMKRVAGHEFGEDSRIDNRAYHKGVSDSTAKARVAHWKKMDKLSDKDPKSYEPAPGDATAKTKESKHTKKYKELYGQ